MTYEIGLNRDDPVFEILGLDAGFGRRFVQQKDRLFRDLRPFLERAFDGYSEYELSLDIIVDDIRDMCDGMPIPKTVVEKALVAYAARARGPPWLVRIQRDLWRYSEIRGGEDPLRAFP